MHQSGFRVAPPFTSKLKVWQSQCIPRETQNNLESAIRGSTSRRRMTAHLEECVCALFICGLHKKRYPYVHISSQILSLDAKTLDSRITEAGDDNIFAFQSWETYLRLSWAGPSPTSTFQCNLTCASSRQRNRSSPSWIGLWETTAGFGATPTGMNSGGREAEFSLHYDLLTP